MWGSGVMVVPVITPDVDSVRGYLPGPTGSWYSMSNAHQYGSVQPTGFSTFSAPRDTPLPCFIRAGSIIPKQRPDITTTATRMHEFQLLIALTQDSMPKAQGELYWDDGEIFVDDITSYKDYIYLEYSMLVETKNMAMLMINCSFGCGSKPSFSIPTLDKIEVFGHAFEPDLTSLKLNDKQLKVDASKCSYDKDKQILLIDTPQLIDFSKDAPVWHISWSEKRNIENNGNSIGIARHSDMLILLVSFVFICHFYV
uniref:Glycosyl hydrolase family 31 C-terminal domain-containing protein n=1 Tax=Ditylenchus dipsaci TaxID=166011 RepID=A0A915E3Q7_9BILA